MIKEEKRKILHNILSNLNVINNGGFFPIKNVIDIGYLKGLDEMSIRRELKSRVKDGYIIINNEMMKLGC